MNIKKYIKDIFKSKIGWCLLKKTFHIIDQLFYFKEEQRKDFERKANTRLTNYFIDSGEMFVRNGVFKGLFYPTASSFCSAFFPKLLGSYEEELHPYIEKIIDEKRILQIIDIGCAEGYYAVGLALKMPNAKVFAYDVDDVPISLCHEMAKHNNVENRVFLRKYFNQESIKAFDCSIPTLIICDCEGFEYELFNETNIKLFSKCELIIELHAFVYSDICNYLDNLFSSTHERILISGKYRNTSKYKKDLKSFNQFEREYALSEFRPCLMDWLYLIPAEKKHSTLV